MLPRVVNPDPVRAGSQCGLAHQPTSPGGGNSLGLREAAISEDGAALVVRLVRAVAGAGHSTHQAADQGALARARPAVGDGAAGRPEARTEEPAERARLGD